LLLAGVEQPDLGAMAVLAVIAHFLVFLLLAAAAAKPTLALVFQVDLAAERGTGQPVPALQGKEMLAVLATAAMQQAAAAALVRLVILGRQTLMAVQELRPPSQGHRLLMQVVVAVVLLLAVLAALEGAATAVKPLLLEPQEQLIRAGVVAAADLVAAERAAQVGLVLLFLAFQHQTIPALQPEHLLSPQAGATQSLHSLLQGAIRHEPFCKSLRWQSPSGHRC